jgi:hypothetical protein
LEIVVVVAVGDVLALVLCPEVELVSVVLDEELEAVVRVDVLDPVVVPKGVPVLDLVEGTLWLVELLFVDFVELWEVEVLEVVLFVVLSVEVLDFVLTVVVGVTLVLDRLEERRGPDVVLLKEVDDLSLVEVREEVVGLEEDVVIALDVVVAPVDVVVELSLVELVVSWEVVGVEVDLLLEVAVSELVTVPVLDFEEDKELVLDLVLETFVDFELRVVEVLVSHDVVEDVTELDFVELDSVDVDLLLELVLVVHVV